FYNTEDRYARDCEAEKEILERYLKLNYGTFSGGVISLSKEISKFLNFPLFAPLEPSFTENDARWLTLIYSTRDPKCEEWFEPLRGLMTLEVVQNLIKTYRNESSVPLNVTVGPITLTRDFWKVMCIGNLVEAYGLPRLHWRFFSQIVSRKSKRTSL
ncbi:hypothetical protein TcCL_NonESM13668, partial [Trypanosoma cruzi]